MSTDKPTPKVYAAINAVQAAMSREGIAKTGKNSQQGYAFRGIDSVYAALSPQLSAHKLCILPRVRERIVTERETKSGGMLFYTTLMVEFDFVSVEDGSMHTICTAGEAMDSADKSSSKAMSAAYKYACFMAFSIPLEGGDNDADATTHEVAPRRQEPIGTPVPSLPPRSPSPEVRAAQPAPERPQNGFDWRSVRLPAFVEKKGKKSTDGTVNGMKDGDLLYWANNFVPKEWQGRIQQGDIDFQRALKEGVKARGLDRQEDAPSDFDSHPGAPESDRAPF